jgi:hypothetical protein
LGPFLFVTKFSTDKSTGKCFLLPEIKESGTIATMVPETLKKVTIRLPESVIRQMHLAAINNGLTKEKAFQVACECWVVAFGKKNGTKREAKR